MMKFIEGAVDWVLNSSADPTKMSLSVRAALVFGFGVFVKIAATGCALGAVCVVTDPGLVEKVIDTVTNIVFWTCSIVGALGFLAGVARKAWNALLSVLRALFG